MPTPFSHLVTAQRLLQDDASPELLRNFSEQERGAFLLGNIAADARVGSGAPRSTTHFYDYAEGIHEMPWRVMVTQNPDLLTPQDSQHRAFVAGYVAHLSMDEIWSRQMVGPHFAEREWGDRPFRFYMLHIILCYMDERDLDLLAPWQWYTLQTAEPFKWVQFMSDDDLRAWQKLIYEQIKPGGESKTLEIFGGRIGKEAQEMRDFLDSPQQMQAGLWDNITKSVLAEVEANMYTHALAQMQVYLSESAIQDNE